jgi:hypothetical protein
MLCPVTPDLSCNAISQSLMPYYWVPPLIGCLECRGVEIRRRAGGPDKEKRTLEKRKLRQLVCKVSFEISPMRPLPFQCMWASVFGRSPDEFVTGVTFPIPVDEH